MAYIDFDNYKFDEVSQEFYQDKIFCFAQNKGTLDVHFKNGGMYHRGVIAGVLEITTRTLHNYLDKDSKYYSKDLDIYLKIKKNEHKKILGSWYLETANGTRGRGNARLLTVLAKKHLDLTETIFSEEKKEIYLKTDEEIDDRLDQIRDELNAK